MPLADGSGEEGMGAMLVDSHTHLLRLEVSPERAVRSAAEVGVVAVVNVGTDVEDSQRGPSLRRCCRTSTRRQGYIPTTQVRTRRPTSKRWPSSESPGIVALGEVGLDYYRSEWSEEVQRALFEDVISLANDTRLPLVIHSAKPSPIRWLASGVPGFLSSCTASRVVPRGQGGDGARLLCRPRRAT